MIVLRKYRQLSSFQQGFWKEVGKERSQAGRERWSKRAREYGRRILGPDRLGMI
ncbi:MAG: hypothetical protein U5N58_00425 [Actinomycetota bacterium]|nr:hypothetical protein [Actinomycetota bacterium]